MPFAHFWKRLRFVLRRTAVRLFGSQWRPTDLPGCVLWLRPGKKTTIHYGLVTRWRNVVDGSDAVAPAPLGSPVYIARSASLNGRPAVRFDGRGEKLEMLTGVRVPFEPKGFSVFAILSPAFVARADVVPMVW